MSVTIVNASTSLVLVDTSVLTSSASTHVVLLSSLQAPGRAVTIRDSLGYLSSPQSILVSTTSGVQFVDGSTRVDIKGRFGFLTVTSYDPTRWNIVNSFGFPLEQTTVSLAGLSVSSLTARTIYASQQVSTATLRTVAANVTSTLTVDGPTYTSSLIVGAQINEPFAYQSLSQGYSAAIQGAAYIDGQVDVFSSLRLTGAISTGSDLFVGGSISTVGSVNVMGNTTLYGNVAVPTGNALFSTLTVTGPTILSGPTLLSNTMLIASNLAVQNQISSLSFLTSTIAVASSIQMQEKAIVWRPAEFLFTHPIDTPSISTNTLTASNAITTSTLSIRSILDATAASQLILSSTAIVNPAGSLVVSSLQANTGFFSNDVSTTSLFTSSILTSTLTLAGNLNAPGTGYLKMNTGLFSSVVTDAIFTGQAFTSQFITNSVSISSLAVSGVINASTITDLNVQSAFINNSQGSFATSSIVTDSIQTSSLTMTNGNLIVTDPVFTISAPSVYFDSLSLSTLTVSSVNTGTLYTRSLQMGSPQNTTGPVGIYWEIADMTNMTLLSGNGDYLNPFIFSNVKPSGIGPGQSYLISLACKPIVPTPTGEFPGNKGVGTSYFYWANEPNSFISIDEGITYATANQVLSQLGLYGSNQTNSFLINGATNSPPGYSPFMYGGTLFGDTSVLVIFGNQSNSLVTFTEPSTVIEMNNGRLQWNYAFRNTTIQNSLNDIATRNLYYYGGLSYTSDPRVKENITYADLARCKEIVRRVPLREYSMTSSYCSTFGVSANRRLGVLANELEEYFPHSVVETSLQCPIGDLTSIKTVDTQQLDMAHYGATQLLIEEVVSLRQHVSTLKAKL